MAVIVKVDNKGLRRRGNIYCSPKNCGLGCTWEEFQAAQRDGVALAARLGAGWTVRMWENLGWYYEAVSPCGRMKVSYHRGASDPYLALLGEADSPGGKWVGHGTTPQAAVDDACASAWEDVRHLVGFVRDSGSRSMPPHVKLLATSGGADGR